MTIKPPFPSPATRCDFDAFAHELGASFERYGFRGDRRSRARRRTMVARRATRRDQGLLRPARRPTKMLNTRFAGAGGQRGYTPFGVETAKGAEHFDLKEFWHTGRELPAGPPLSLVHARQRLARRGRRISASPSARLYDALDRPGCSRSCGPSPAISASPTTISRRRFISATASCGCLHYPPSAVRRPERAGRRS